jgi:hypothetical protein
MGSRGGEVMPPGRPVRRAVGTGSPSSSPRFGWFCEWGATDFFRPLFFFFFFLKLLLLGNIST